MATIYPKITHRYGGEKPVSLSPGEIFIKNTTTDYGLFTNIGGSVKSIGPTSGTIWGQNIEVSSSNQIRGDMRNVSTILFNSTYSDIDKNKVYIGSSTSKAQRPDEMYINNAIYITNKNGNGAEHDINNSLTQLDPGKIFLSDTAGNSLISFYLNTQFSTANNKAHWTIGTTNDTFYGTDLAVYRSSEIPDSNFYVNAPTIAEKFIKIGGTSKQFLKADGSVDESICYYSNWLSTSPGGRCYWTTEQFLNFLKINGALFSQTNYWIAKCSWTYRENAVINDTECGNCDLTGAIIEVFSGNDWTVNGGSQQYIVRVTTAPASSKVPDDSGTEGGIPNAVFTYRNHGPAYEPNWSRIGGVFNNPNESETVNEVPVLAVVQLSKDTEGHDEGAPMKLKSCIVREPLQFEKFIIWDSIIDFNFTVSDTCSDLQGLYANLTIGERNDVDPSDAILANVDTGAKHEWDGRYFAYFTNTKPVYSSTQKKLVVRSRVWHKDDHNNQAMDSNGFGRVDKMSLIVVGLPV